MAAKRNSTVTVGDVMVTLSCRCGSVLVRKEQARSWRCPDCRRNGVVEDGKVVVTKTGDGKLEPLRLILVKVGAGGGEA